MKGDVVFYMISLVLIFLFTIYQSIYILMNEKTSLLLKTIAVIVLTLTVLVGSLHTTYLPFLGRTVLPVSLLKDVSDVKAGDITVKVPVNAPDNTHVVYWAAKSNDSIVKTPSEAYAEFKNSGVALVKDKFATFHIECPASYKVPYTTLSPHVHYRIAQPNGLLGIVKTLHIDCDKK